MIILEGAGALEPRTVSLTHAAVLCVAPGYCSLELSFPRKLPSSVASSPPLPDPPVLAKIMLASPPSGQNPYVCTLSCISPGWAN